MTLRFLWRDIMQIMPMSCHNLLRRSRSEMYGVQIVRREDASASLCSVILTFWEKALYWQKSN